MALNKFDRLVWLGVIGFALAFFTAGAWLMAARHRRAESLARAEGTVVDVKSYSPGPGQAASVSARVRYRTADGREVEFTDGLRSRAYGPGDRVEVLYDPRAPEGAEINAGHWVEPAVLLLVGAMPLAARLVWWCREYGERRRRRRKGLPDVEERMTWPAASRRPRLPK